MFITILIDRLIGIVSFVIPILMVIATIVFLWGVISYIVSAGSEEKKKTAKTYIAWGLIGLFVMVTMWGIVRAVVYTFDLTGLGLPPGPRVVGEFPNLVAKIIFSIIDPLITLMFVLGTVVFLWGIIEFILASGSGDEDKIKSGKRHMVWGLIGLFAMVSVFAIVEAFRYSLGFSGLPYIPHIFP